MVHPMCGRNLLELHVDAAGHVELDVLEEDVGRLAAQLRQLPIMM